MSLPHGYIPPPRELDLDHPHPSRVSDYLLGGGAHWAVDREFADTLCASHPCFTEIIRAGRGFLHRVVAHLVRRGVRQILDIGAGMDTITNTHEIADATATGCRVVYLDHDPIAVAHLNARLDEIGDPARHTVITADLRGPEELWRRVRGTGLLDLDQPVAVLMIGVLHWTQPGPDGGDITPQAVTRHRALMPPGSYLALSHLTDDGIPDPHALSDIQRRLTASTNPVTLRSQPQIRALLGEFTLQHPGMTWAPQWHPDNTDDTGDTTTRSSRATPHACALFTGLAQKPHN
ncbi:MAG: SAM-dependent methyltransferase [Sciscionella sp.]